MILKPDLPKWSTYRFFCTIALLLTNMVPSIFSGTYCPILCTRFILLLYCYVMVPHWLQFSATHVALWHNGLFAADSDRLSVVGCWTWKAIIMRRHTDSFSSAPISSRKRTESASVSCCSSSCSRLDTRAFLSTWLNFCLLYIARA